MICRVVGSVQTLVAALVCIIGLLVGNKSVKQTYTEAALTVRPLRPWPYHFSGKGVWSIQCPRGKLQLRYSSSTAHSSKTAEDLLPEFSYSHSRRKRSGRKN